MGLASPVRQIVFGIDDSSGLSFWPREGLDMVVPFRGRAEIEGRQGFCLAPPSFLALLERLLATTNAPCDELLDHEWKGELRIGRHPFNNGRQFSGVIARSCDPFECMAVRTGPNRRLLLLGSWK